MESKTTQSIEPAKFDEGTRCWLEAPERPISLEVHHRDGSIQAFPYAHLLFLDYVVGTAAETKHEDSAIYLLFATHDVAIRGQSLHPLVRLLGQNMVLAVRESSTEFIKEHAQAKDKEIFIRQIDIALRSPDEDQG
ncbi:MAG: hypothetical protein WCH98_02755 [Verrucomicrobiota bacterium]